MLTLHVQVQPACYSHTATLDKHILREVNIGYISDYSVCHIFVRLKTYGFHLSHHTLDNMPVLQRQERDKKVDHVVINQT